MASVQESVDVIVPLNQGYKQWTSNPSGNVTKPRRPEGIRTARDAQASVVPLSSE